MSDLISRSEVVGLLTNLQLEGGDLHDAKRFIAVMPAAYDLDKVVEQLEEKYGCISCEWDDLQCEHDRHCVVYEILDFLKAGGVDDKPL